MAALDAGHTIVTPAAELAAALVAAVERHYLALGRAVWPTPKIHDFRSWVQEQFEQRQMLHGGLLRSLTDLEERELWRCVVSDQPPASGPLDLDGVAQLARRAYRAMTDYGIPHQSLGDYPSDDSALLEAWILAFEGRCSQLGLLNPAARLQALPATVEAPHWIESAAWRPAARRWLEKSRVSSLAPQIAAGDGEASLCGLATPADEFAAAAEWARANLERRPDFRAWIYFSNLDVRRKEIERAFDAAVARDRFELRAQTGPAAYAIAGGTPLAQQAPVGLALETLTAAHGAVSFESFSRLLRSRDLNSGDVDESNAAALDIELRAFAPHEATLVDWLELATRVADERRLNASTPLRRLRGAEHELGPPHDQAALSAWAARWRRALDLGPWEGRTSWSSREFQAAQRLRDLIDALARADAVFGHLSAGAALRVLQRAVRETPFQPQTGVPAIWVTGQALDPWLAYDGIWVGDVSSRSWPPPMQPVPLLPIHLQRRYGITVSSATLQLDAGRDLQKRWLQRGSTKIFSYARDDAGELRQASALTASMRRVGAATECAPRSGVFALHRHWQLPRRADFSLETFGDEMGPKLELPLPRPLNVASLREQSQCAFRGFAATQLRLKAIDSPVAGFNRMERGILLHHALHTLWARLQTLDALRRLSADERQQALQHAVQSAFDARVVRRAVEARWAVRERRRMLALLDRWLDVESARISFTVTHLEHQQRVTLRGDLEFSFRIDRVDRLGSGGQIIIDYKTGAASRDWCGERPKNPQLALYAHSIGEPLAAVAYGQLTARECGFVVATDEDAIFNVAQRASNLEAGGSMTAQLALWMQRIERIAGQMAAGFAAVDPLPGVCNSCHLAALCRIGADAHAGADAEAEEISADVSD